MFNLYASRLLTDGATDRQFICQFPTEDSAFDFWRDYCAQWELEGYGMEIRRV